MRSTSFVSKAPSSWTEHTERLANSRFYLMARIGPTVFQIKDDEDASFKITLGNPHRCSCLNQNQPCIHVAYCVVKILKVQMSHQLAYQSSWTDSDLEQVLSGAFSVRQVNAAAEHSRRLRIFRRGREASEEAGEAPLVAEEEDNAVARQKLAEEEDNYCPICQETMQPDELYTLTWCRSGCGNNLHVACMMKYSQHLQNNRKDTNCPLCRAAWNMERLQKDNVFAHKMKEKIEREINEKKKRASMFRNVPVYCSQCSCILHDTFYRCVNCTHQNVLISQGNVGNTRQMCDFCEDCLSRSFISSREAHLSHLFLSNNAAEDLAEQSWSYMTQTVATTSANIIRDSIDSLPGVVAMIGRGLIKDFRKARCWICDEYVSKDNASGVFLPCKHVVHKDCLLRETESAFEGQAGLHFGHLLRCRCGFNSCGKRLFPGLKRTMKKLSAATKEATKDTAESVSATNMATMSLFGTSPLMAAGIAMGSVTGAEEATAAAARGTAGDLRHPLRSHTIRKFTQQFKLAIVNDLKLNGEGIASTNNNNNNNSGNNKDDADIMHHTHYNRNNPAFQQQRKRIATIRSLSRSRALSTSDDHHSTYSSGEDLGQLLVVSLQNSNNNHNTIQNTNTIQNNAIIRRRMVQQATSASPSASSLQPTRTASASFQRESESEIGGGDLDLLLAVRPMGGANTHTNNSNNISINQLDNNHPYNSQNTARLNNNRSTSSSSQTSNAHAPMTRRDRQRRLEDLGFIANNNSNNSSINNSGIRRSAAEAVAEAVAATRDLQVSNAHNNNNNSNNNNRSFTQTHSTSVAER